MPVKYKLSTGDTVDITAITKANQGAGSGLDSDMVDGLHGASYEEIAHKGVADGYVPLDSGGKVPSSYLPGLALTDVWTVGSEAAQLALTAQEGDIAIRTDLSKSYAHNGGTAGTMADWSELLSPTATVSSVFGRTGAVVAQANDYTWGQINKAVSSLVDITTKSHTVLSDIGSNTHPQLDTILDRLRITQIKDGFKLMNLQNLPLLISGYAWRDEFRDSTGIDAGLSSDYIHRGTPDFDVITSTATKALLHMNGADGSTTFTDETEKIWTAYGNAQIDTAQSKFGGASGLFDGTGDFISTPDSADWDLIQTGVDFTIDLWVKHVNTTGLQMYFSHGPASTDAYYVMLNGGTLNFSIDVSGVNQFSLSGGTISDTSWHHVALTKSGTTYKLWLDGVNTATAAYTGTVNFTSNFRVGIYADAINYGMNGWIDEFCVSKGIAKWTANFTPPTGEYSYLQAVIASVVWASPATNPATILVSWGETLGTGSLSVFVSRDNGTTWTAITTPTTVAGDPDYVLKWKNVDVSAQPAGSNLRVKTEIIGNAQLEAISMAV